MQTIWNTCLAKGQVKKNTIMPYLYIRSADVKKAKIKKNINVFYSRNTSEIWSWSERVKWGKNYNIARRNWPPINFISKDYIKCEA